MTFERWYTAFERDNDDARLVERDPVDSMRLAYEAGATAIDERAAKDLITKFEKVAAEHLAFPTIESITAQYVDATKLLLAAMRPGVEIVTAAIVEFETRAMDEGTRNEYVTGIGRGYDGAASFLEDALDTVKRHHSSKMQALDTVKR